MDFFKNKKAIYVVSGLILVIIVGGIIYFNRQSPQDSNLPSGQAKATGGSLDISIFKTSFFESLTRYGQFPIEVRFSGRENPFEQYQ